MSRKKIKKKNIVDRFVCLQCGHNWEEKRKPGPYWGYGWDEYGKPTTKEQDEVDTLNSFNKETFEYWCRREAVHPEHLPCPKCSHLYYTRI